MLRWNIILKSTKLKSFVGFLLFWIVFFSHGPLKELFGEFGSLLAVAFLVVFGAYGVFSPMMSVFEKYFDLKYMKKNEPTELEKRAHELLVWDDFKK